MDLHDMSSQLKSSRQHESATTRTPAEVVPIHASTSAGGPALSVRKVSVSYGAHEVLRELDVTLSAGEFVCIVGPSGVGKTTLLRCLSGLMMPTQGSVNLANRQITSPPPEIAVVFQDYSRSLLPWLRARENVALPLKGRGMKRKEREAKADEALASVGLGDAGGKYPWQLSGGMQQRVAIARALAYDARILLMDEPFASVDAQTRFELEDLVLELRSRLGISIVLVTHDIDEAVYLSDRVVVLSGKPAAVADVVAVDLDYPRDQIETRANPLFAELRTRILRQIRKGGA